MKAENIVLLGVKHSVIAFRRDTGVRIWSKDLGSGLTADFVTLISDEKRVFAHSGSEIFCLNLFTGTQLWHDKLTGLGHGLASIGLPGSPTSNASQMAQMQYQQASDSGAVVPVTTV